MDEEGNEWNPRLHLAMHAAVLGQIEEVKEVRETFKDLQSKHQLHPHAAIHALTAVLSQVIFKMLKEEKKYERIAHRDQLDELLNPESELYQTYVQPLKGGEPPTHRKIR